MQLTEAEIERLIEQYVWAGRHVATDGTLELGLKGTDKAAHAIAEKMREGVVFWDEGEAHSMGYTSKDRLLAVNGHRMQLAVYGFSPEELARLEGQLVTVTVAKKEEK